MTLKEIVGALTKNVRALSFDKKKMTVRSASIHKRKNIFYVTSNSLTTVGVWLRSPPYLKIEYPSSSNALGQSIISALSASSKDIPHPKDFTKSGKDFLQAFELKSYRQIQDEFSFHCNITLQNGIITITPSRNIGVNRGFTYLADVESINVKSSDTPKNITKAILAAFEKCTFEEEEEEISHT